MKSSYMKRYGYMFLLLVLVYPVLGQEDLDVHLDSAREMLGAMGMVSLAGLTTDRGGIAHNRGNLNVYLECEGMRSVSTGTQSPTCMPFCRTTCCPTPALPDGSAHLRWESPNQPIRHRLSLSRSRSISICCYKRPIKSRIHLSKLSS